MASRQRQWWRVAALSWSDFLFEWRVSLCLVLALAAILGPLLILFGLRSGIIHTLRERLRADPANRELIIVGHRSLSSDWFTEVGARSGVAFVVPRTRELSATMTLEMPERESLRDLDMIPSGLGDPVLASGQNPPQGLREVLLSHTASRRLAAAAGARVSGRVERRHDGRFEALDLPLRVAGVVPETAFSREAVFVSLELLTAVEDYRDGLAVASLGVEAGERRAPSERRFASARLYAREIDDVAPLADSLRAGGIEVISRAREIEAVRSIDRVLSLVFGVLAAIGVLGFVASLTVSLWANVDRKRREIALLRLLGVRRATVLGFPAFQAAFVAAAGIALSAATYGVVAEVFDVAFATHLAREEFVCRLEIRDGLLAAGSAFLLALTAAMVGGYSAMRIDPAESLREP